MAWLGPRVPWRKVDYWVLDLESSGIDPGKSEILAVGMVPIFEGTIRWGHRLYRQVRPRGGSVGERETVAVHQLTATELQAAASLSEVLPEVFTRLEKAVLVVHHAALDVALLRHAACQASLAFPRLRVVDTVRLLERYNRRGEWLGRGANPVSFALDAARRHFELAAHAHHHALADALATAELFLCLRAKLRASTLRELL